MDLSELTNSEPSQPESHVSESKLSTSDATNQGSDKSNDQKVENAKEALENNISNSRSTSEYRALYNHLLNKFKAARDISRLLINFEQYLKNLSKYQQLRNNMLIETLLFINNNECLHPSNYWDHQEIIGKLESVRKSDKKLGNFINQLIKLEDEEANTNKDHVLQKFNDIIGIDDVLSSDLSIQEANIYPDNYLGDFDSYEIVKKNQCFANEISSFAELQALVHPEQSEIDLEEDLSYPSRKRKSSSFLGSRKNSKKSNIDAISLSPVNIMPRLELYETSGKRSKKK